METLGETINAFKVQGVSFRNRISITSGYKCLFLVVIATYWFYAVYPPTAYSYLLRDTNGRKWSNFQGVCTIHAESYMPERISGGWRCQWTKIAKKNGRGLFAYIHCDSLNYAHMNMSKLNLGRVASWSSRNGVLLIIIRRRWQQKVEPLNQIS